jgi:transcription initiation factor TFIIIB Brf1 subunit/transcription initiation factor TFIIB
MSSFKCDDCDGINLVDYHGDITCKDCGLVKYTHAIDDTVPSYNNYLECESAPNISRVHTIVGVSKKTIAICLDNDTKIEGVFKEHIERFNFDDTFRTLVFEWYNIAIRNELALTTKKQVFRGKKRLFVLGLSIYCASIYTKRGISITYIANILDIHFQDLWKHLDDILQLWCDQKWYKHLLTNLSTHDDKLTRTVHELDCIPNNCIWKVLQNAKKLYKLLKNTAKLNAVKSHTLNACCIYIGCLSAGVKVGRIIFCKQVGISIPTLKLHETIIQEVLQSTK